MALVTVQLESVIERSFRVAQVAGMLDVPVDECTRHTLTVEVPGVDEAWTIGAIVGPSGSGKTTLARAAFGEAVWEPRVWPAGRAIVEVLGSAECGVRNAACGENASDCSWSACKRDDGTRSVPTTIKDIARVLAAVGLGSVPTWLKPYDVLSTGERFRADVARAVIQRSEVGDLESAEESVLVFDEFTSALDRRVARTVSAALARLVRRRDGGLRLVAVTCHADVLPWLTPDWVVELKDEGGGMKDEPRQARLTWPVWEGGELPIEIRRVPQAMWQAFARHHYLSGGMAASATCYAAYATGAGDGGLGERRCAGGAALAGSGTPTSGRGFECMAFCAVVAALGWKQSKRITRLVVLPEFQGLGIASRLLAEVARIEAGKGNRVTITASHPAIVGHCSRSAAWRLVGVKKLGSTRQRFEGREISSSRGRAVATFEFGGNSTC